MRLSRQERIELHERMEQDLPGIRKHLQSKFPEVTSVDIGLKETDGVLSHTFAWRIFVKEKKDRAQLRQEQFLPKEIIGYPTDVHQYREMNLEAEDTSGYDPLWGGIQITGDGTGTLGCFCTDNTDPTGQIHILSNHHVLMGDFGAAAGGFVGQPGGASRVCCCTCGNHVATVIRGVIGNPANPAAPVNIIDAAIARLLNQTVTPADPKTVYYTNKIIGIGPVFGSTAPMVDDVVRKRGRTLQLVVGRIASITDTVTITKTGLVYPSNQLDLRPTHGHPDWSEGGDSGSAVVNNMNQVVGLHFAGGGTTGNACNITNVIAGLNITILSSGTLNTIPVSGWGEDALYPEPQLMVAHRDDLFGQLAQVVKARPGGDALLTVAYENSSEVLDLINDNREVAVAWNRFHGPEFVGHMAKNAKEPQHQVPTEIQGYNLQNLLIKMNDVLERHGSRKLSAALEEYFTEIYDFAESYQNAPSLEALLANGQNCPECGTLNPGHHGR